MFKGLLWLPVLGLVHHQFWVTGHQVRAVRVQHHQLGPARASVHGPQTSQYQAAGHAGCAPDQQYLACIALVCIGLSLQLLNQCLGIEGLCQMKAIIDRDAVSNCETPRNTCANGLCRW